MTTAEIITIGTELLLGETTDTNTRCIARFLRGVGVDLFRTQTIGDNTRRITEAVQLALARADIVITTGGLGPTVDDPTRQAIAQAVGRELEFHPELWEQISARISLYGRIPTGNQMRQAYIPKGALIIENPVGTAPSFIVDTARGVVISLPGVPHEMETLLTDSIVPYLQDRFELHSVIKVHTLHVSGLGEGVIDDQVGDLETLTNPTIGLAAHAGVVDIRITAKAATGDEAGGMIAHLEKELRIRMKENIYGSDDDTLEGITLETIRCLGWSLASFEFQTEQALNMLLARTGDPTYRGGRVLRAFPENLGKEALEIGKEFDAPVVLGVACGDFREKQDIHAVWATPLVQDERQFCYGGHPKNARRWAVNMALDALRRALQEP